MADASRFVFDWRRRARDLAIYLAIGVFLSILNPFGATSGAPLWVAATYWVSLVLLGSLAGEAATIAVGRLWPRLPDWGAVPIVATVVSAVLLPTLLLVEWVIRGETIAPKDWLRSFSLIWVVAIGITIVSTLIRRATEARAAPASTLTPGPMAGQAGAPFMDRLPVRLRTAELWAVQSEDHYLRVHTSAGQEMILMRLADALKELAAVEGLQTHRSWWVAKQGLADISKGSGKLVLTLKSGIEAPVSRTYQPAVREAGWI
jgi:hypothetical protein